MTIGKKIVEAAAKAAAKKSAEKAAQRFAVKSEEEASRKAAEAVAKEAVSRLSVPVAQTGRSTIYGAKRKAFPEIYRPSREIAERAESMVAPESTNLGRLFGVTRADLAKAGNVPGSKFGVIPGLTARARGAKAAEPLMGEANTRRLVNALEAGREYAPGLTEGMTGWYMLDPAFNRLVDLVGYDEAVKRFERLNTLTAMASPSSDVVTELMRGTAENKLASEGRFGEFMQYGGLPLEQRKAMGLPEDLLTFPSHAYHKTAQAPAMAEFIRTGASQMKSPKVPLYMQASQATPIGRQTDIPVADAHWSRAVGLADVRPMRMVKGESAIPGQSVSTPELISLAPWWREQVARKAGYESVPAQANLWGIMGPQTGVETQIGAPKLEILADLIAGRTAPRLGVTPEEARDLVLLGKAQAGKATPEALGALAAAGLAGAGAETVRRKKKKKD